MRQGRLELYPIPETARMFDFLVLVDSFKPPRPKAFEDVDLVVFASYCRPGLFIRIEISTWTLTMCYKSGVFLCVKWPLLAGEKTLKLRLAFRCLTHIWWRWLAPSFLKLLISSDFGVVLVGWRPLLLSIFAYLHCFEFAKGQSDKFMPACPPTR